jgi:DNA-binding response OmpR family regulator
MTGAGRSRRIEVLMELRVLVVDDEPSMQRLFRAIMREVGYSVDCVGTTAEAEAALAQTTYGGMLLDYQLPGEDGVRFLRRYCGAAALPPTFIITGHDIAPLERTVDHPAVKAILAKPVEFETISTLTRQYFGHGADLQDPDASPEA